MNQPYARVNQPYATLMLASALREMFGVQLYKNNARALLSRILSILNLDWLQHARSVRGVYESKFISLIDQLSQGRIQEFSMGGGQILLKCCSAWVPTHSWVPYLCKSKWRYANSLQKQGALPLNGWQLAKMKKSIPDMSLSWNL